MIECYYRECIHHDKDEPFCGKRDYCRASPKEIETLQVLRQLYLDEVKEKYERQKNRDN